tara:strand:+ start:1211 stop:1351 length:141 start_codon:yes stop_codon:yes gene_type:complete
MLFKGLQKEEAKEGEAVSKKKKGFTHKVGPSPDFMKKLNAVTDKKK